MARDLKTHLPENQYRNRVFDRDGNFNYVSLDGDSTTTEGSVLHLLVQDNNNEALLSDVLKELKKMNLHLSLLTDINIENSEVD